MVNIDEVKGLLDSGRTGVKVTSNGVVNFIEYPISTEDLAKQICQLFESNKLTLPTKEEMEEWIHEAFGYLNPEFRPYLLMGVEALYVKLGGTRFIEIV